MFNGFFGDKRPTNIEVKNAINDMFYHAMNQRNRSVKYIINKYKLNLNSEECFDQYGNNLLHIAARSNNYELAKDLILMGVDKNKKNNYSSPETPLDIAMKNYNINMIRILEDLEGAEFLKERVGGLEKKNEGLHNDLAKVRDEKEIIRKERDEIKRSSNLSRKRVRLLEDDNSRLVSENRTLTNDNRTLRRNLKSKCEECDEYGRTVKKQKKDIDDLNKLVETYRDSIKK